jgi:hypothetical protein
MHYETPQMFDLGAVEKLTFAIDCGRRIDGALMARIGCT